MTSTPAFDLSILIVGYNSLEFLDDCLRSIEQACARCSHETLFVNNGTDESEAFVRRHFPAVKVLASHGNVGFAQASNRLAGHASGRHLLLLNPDTQLMPNALDLMVEVADKTPTFGIFGALTVNEQGAPEEMAMPALPSLSRLAGSILRVGLPKTIDPNAVGPVETTAVSGGCMFVRREVWDLLGGLDEDYFLYAEDVDFCRRHLNAGGRIAILPESKVLHHVGSGAYFSPVRRRFMLLGIATYYRKHFSRPYAFACVSVLWAACVSRFVAGRILSAFSSHYRKMADAYSFGALHPLKWASGYQTLGADPRLANGRPVTPS